MSDLTGKIHDVVEQSRETAAEAYASARERVAAVSGRTGSTLRENALSAVVGGVALGALLGTLLPRSQREIAALDGIGDKLGEAARGAVSKAREAGRDQLGELTRSVAGEQVKSLLDSTGLTKESDKD